MIDYSVIIPVFNSSGSIIEITDAIREFFESENLRYEILLINDGSSNPDTAMALQIASGRNPAVRVIHLRRNYGQHAATLCGLEHSRGHRLITMDDDLQHDPGDIRLLMEKKDHDIVIAGFNVKIQSFSQRILSWIKNKLDEILLKKPHGLRFSSFRLLKREIARSMLSIQTPYPYLPSLMLLVTGDIVNVPVTHRRRSSGKSGYTWSRIIRLAFNLLFNNSTILLRWMAVAGFSTATLCLLTMFWFLFKKIVFAINVPGWTSLFVLMAGIGGLLLGGLGIIGEFLARILTGIEKRPAYFIKEDSNELR